MPSLVSAVPSLRDGLPSVTIHGFLASTDWIAFVCPQVNVWWGTREKGCLRT